MQTRDEVEGLHNCREFSQPLECLYQAMQTRKTFSIGVISTSTFGLNFHLINVNRQNWKKIYHQRSRLPPHETLGVRVYSLIFNVYHWNLFSADVC